MSATWKKRTTAAVIATVLALLLGEVALGLLNPHAKQWIVVRDYVDMERGKFCRFDPDLGWTGKPDVNDVFRTPDAEHRVRQNRYGFRGEAYPLQRGDRHRIVVLGDSFVWGFGVEDDQIFTARLEQAAHGRTEVVNLGVSGFGTDQSVILWGQLGRQFTPDTVLLAVTAYTDHWENMVDSAHYLAKPLVMVDSQQRVRVLNTPLPEPQGKIWQLRQIPIEGPKARWLSYAGARSSLVATALLGFARHPSIHDWLSKRCVLPPRTNHMAYERQMYTTPTDATTHRAYTQMLRLIDALNQQVGQAGAELMVMMVPADLQVDDWRWRNFSNSAPLAPGKTLDRDLPNGILARHCESRGIVFIDPQDDLRAAAHTHPPLYFPWNRHWTAGGHQIVADKLAEILLPRDDGH